MGFIKPKIKLTEGMNLKGLPREIIEKMNEDSTTSL